MARAWYAYDTIGNPFLFTSYRLQSSTPGCLNGPVVCSIYALAGAGSAPLLLSDNMRTYIADGLANNVAEPATPPNQKFYVYMKGLAQ